MATTNLEEFKKLVRKAIFLTHDAEKQFLSIPDVMWQKVFDRNFNGNLAYAQRVILNKFKELEKIDTVRVDNEKLKIYNLDRATEFLVKAIEEKSPVIFITDFDNDGSLAQAIINQYIKIDSLGSENMHVEYAQTVNGNSNRGFTVDLVEKIINFKGIDPNAKFTVVTADNGINSREEQVKIQEKYPNAHIIVTDHHNPEDDMVVQDDDRSVIFNPHYNPTEFYKKFNISGATTIGVLLKNLLNERYSKEELEPYSANLDIIDKISKVSNLLDYVNTDPADKPEKDYIVSKFLKLQPLLNVNNSISKIITGELHASTIKAIENKIPDLNVGILTEEAENIHTQNQVAKVLLHIFKDYNENPNKNGLAFNNVLLTELSKDVHYENYQVINANYIEQLRPLIFELAADDNKSVFLDELNNYMIGVFESIRNSEKSIIAELRRGEVVSRTKLPYSTIYYADPHILGVFNRKFLNKAYNDENTGFLLTLDNLNKNKVSGSFRSLFDIKDILREKEALEKQLGVKIETPGHERAAGFIIKSNPSVITEETIAAINKHINDSIANLKLENKEDDSKNYLLTDLNSIHLVDKINAVIRGNVSNFEHFTPIIEINKDTIWTDSYSTQQFSMPELINNRKYGYVTINTNFHGDGVIIPVELIRKVVQEKYNQYLSLSYMDGGVFMVGNTLAKADVKPENIIDLRIPQTKSAEIEKVFSTDFKDKHEIYLSREQIMDNPFFKYHDYGQLNFDLFENMVINLIDAYKSDVLTVFDVEANGFGNSKLMNFGAMNYNINKKTGVTITEEEFNKKLYRTLRGEEYLLDTNIVSELIPLSETEVESIDLEEKKFLFTQQISGTKKLSYYTHPVFSPLISDNYQKQFFKSLLRVRNYKLIGENVIYNREIEGNMLAFLVKDSDFKVPQEMEALTGINQYLLDNYGVETKQVDKYLSTYYKNIKVLAGAHNTPYDARVLRVNTPKFYEVLKQNFIYDSALFSKNEQLAYDETKVVTLETKETKSKDGGLLMSIYFYNNPHSEINLTDFLKAGKNGLYPDRTGRYLIEIEDGTCYLVDKEEHDKVQIPYSLSDLIERSENRTGLPNTSIKYSVEKLSEQWMIRALLLSDEKFKLKYVSLNDEFEALQVYSEEMRYFQDNYLFNRSLEDNVFLFAYHSNLPVDSEVLLNFGLKFLEDNKHIQQKFADAWMYKKVLSIKEPSRREITNDLIDLVYYQTQIPKEKIVTIFNEAVAFKEKYKIDGIMQHEGHVNGPWEGDHKGDVCFEDKLTLSLLAQKEYNSYTHSLSSALYQFKKYSLHAQLIFDKADNLSEDIANDSYSYRQALTYERNQKSEIVKSLQKKEKLLHKKNKQIIKFKLGNDVLPVDSAVYGINKKPLTRELVEEHSEKLAYILVNEQIKYSLSPDNKLQSKVLNENVKEIIKEALEYNSEKILAYKADLAEYYSYIEFNRQDAQIKKLIERFSKAIFEKSVSGKTPPIDDIEQESFDKVSDIVYNIIEKCGQIDFHIDVDTSEFISEELSKLRNVKQPTRIDLARNNANLPSFKTDEIRDDSFLRTVDISRRDPDKILLHTHAELRLLNNFVQSKMRQHLQLSNHNKFKM